jgi:hypothetical protein
LESDLQAQQTVQATATLATLQRATSTSIKIVQAIAKSYATAKEVATGLARMFKIPVLVYGWDIPQTTAHVGKALLQSGYTKNNPDGFLFQSQYITNVLSYIGEDGHNRNWYKKLPVYKNRRSGEWLDEYPYASTEQGGEANYNNNKVSLRAVPDWEQRRQGGILSSFYDKGLISEGGASDPMSWFVNFAGFGSVTHMYDRSGNRNYFYL